jgi:uncharacterized membrane protein YcaP (DUF421 family)
MDLPLRALIAFLFIFLLTRIIGRRELSSMEPFDLILLVVLGDLVQQGVTQSDYSVTGLLIAAATFAGLTVGVSYANFRIPSLRRVLEGEPIVIVRDGKLIEKNLRSQRLTREEVEAEARLQQIDSLDKVAWAILETNGQISFISSNY